MPRKVRRQMNVLNPTQRFQLAKVAETLQEDQFSNWEEAASFLSSQVGTNITQHNVVTALEMVNRKGLRIVKKQNGAFGAFFTNLTNRLTTLEERVSKIEAELK